MPKTITTSFGYIYISIYIDEHVYEYKLLFELGTTTATKDDTKAEMTVQSKKRLKDEQNMSSIQPWYDVAEHEESISVYIDIY
jgi:hypothetical protein